MPTRENAASMNAIREAARLRVADTSERLAAGEIGISRQSLHAFINGSEPYGPNLAKLRDWYGRETNEVLRLRQEIAELKRRLAECEKRKGTKVP